MIEAWPRDEAAIRQTRSAFNDAIARKDLNAIAAVLRDDYLVVPSGSTDPVDKRAILTVYADHFADPAFVTFDRITDRILFSIDRQRAAELGLWRGSWRSDGAQRIRSGTYQAVWLASAQGWSLIRESYELLDG